MGRMDESTKFWVSFTGLWGAAKYVGRVWKTGKLDLPAQKGRIDEDGGIVRGDRVEQDAKLEAQLAKISESIGANIKKDDKKA